MNKPKKIRVMSKNGFAFAAALVAAGFEAEFLGPCTAHKGLNNGCSDPGHCPQHDAYYNPRDWGAILTNAPRVVARRVFQEVRERENA